MAEPKGARCGAAWAAAAGALLLVALAAACGSSSATQSSSLPTPPPTPTPPPPPPKLALLSIDGLRPDALTASGSSQILGVAQRGSYTWTAQTVFPSWTLPGHTSMLTGVEPTTHGVTFDEYRDTFTLSVPTVFSLAHAAGKRVVMVVGKTKLKQLDVTGTVDTCHYATRGDIDVANEAIGLLPAGFDLLFVHFPQTDSVGHASGWMSADYLAQVKDTDAAVGRLLSVLPRETTVIITADHGGADKVHGSKSAADMTIPWVIAGPGVVHRGLLTRPVQTLDTALTILQVLGLPPAAKMAGKVVSEAFEPQ